MKQITSTRTNTALYALAIGAIFAWLAISAMFVLSPMPVYAEDGATHCTGAQPSPPGGNPQFQCNPSNGSCTPTDQTPTWLNYCCKDLQSAECKDVDYRVMCCTNEAHTIHFWEIRYRIRTLSALYTCGVGEEANDCA